MQNKRLLAITQLLLEQDGYITIADISHQLNVSNKTIRNDLKQIADWLAENGLILIRKTGVGIAVEGDKHAQLSISRQLQKKSRESIDYSPQARKTYIQMKLILNPSCRIHELAAELYVSRTTIHKDLVALSPTFEAYKIKLNRKNNNGVSVEGSEKNYRKMLVDLMTHDKGYHVFSKLVKNTDTYPCDGSLPYPALDFNDDEIQEFLNVLERTNNSFLHSLLFDTLVQLMLYLLVTFIRVSGGHFITLSDAFIRELDQQPCFEDVRQLCLALQQYYPISFTEEEMRYLQVFFISLQSGDKTEDENRQEAEQLTTALLCEWERQLPYSFSDDAELRDAIFRHLCPAITRFRHGISIENSLMDDIYDMYANTFAVVRNSMSILEEYYHCQISDDEAGLIALHLASALDRRKNPLNTLLITHDSMGAANLLRRKLQTQLPELRITDARSYVGMEKADFTGFDLILSTTELPVKVPVPVLVISPLLHDYDVPRLRSLIQPYYKSKNDPNRQGRTENRP